PAARGKRLALACHLGDQGGADRAKTGETDFQRLVHESAPGGERNDVVQFFNAGLEEAADIARGLADALLVLDQRDTHEALAEFAKADARRHRKIRLLDQ